MGSRPRNTTPQQSSRGPSADLPPILGRAAAIAAKLAELWPDAVVELDHTGAWQLLVATILAAQSTDKLINTVTPALFARYPDATALARADQTELEGMIFSTGFYRMKARNLIGMAQRVVERYGGKIPETMDGLVDLPGVARKTANVVLGGALGKNEGIVVDTHVSRLAPRLGLTSETDPVKIENDLMQLIPRDEWTRFAHRLIWHGRRVCHAKRPDCEHCALAPLCPSSALAATPELMPPRSGKPAPPSRARRAAAAGARAEPIDSGPPRSKDRNHLAARAPLAGATRGAIVVATRSPKPKAAPGASAIAKAVVAKAASVGAKAARLAKTARAKAAELTRPTGRKPDKAPNKAATKGTKEKRA